MFNKSCLLLLLPLLPALAAVPPLLLFPPHCPACLSMSACSCCAPTSLCNPCHHHSRPLQRTPTPTGLGGAGVLDALNPLLQQQLADARGKSKPYHFIVFEAGINDILMKNQKAPEIFERM